MIVLKKILILLIVLVSMALAYMVVNFLKSKINARKNFGNFLLLLILSFGAIFLIILALGSLLFAAKDFFFKH
jgi:hypothetical protein